MDFKLAHEIIHSYLKDILPKNTVHFENSNNLESVGIKTLWKDEIISETTNPYLVHYEKYVDEDTHVETLVPIVTIRKGTLLFTGRTVTQTSEGQSLSYLYKMKSHESISSYLNDTTENLQTFFYPYPYMSRYTKQFGSFNTHDCVVTTKDIRIMVLDSPSPITHTNALFGSINLPDTSSYDYKHIVKFCGEIPQDPCIKMKVMKQLKLHGYMAVVYDALHLWYHKIKHIFADEGININETVLFQGSDFANDIHVRKTDMYDVSDLLNTMINNRNYGTPEITLVPLDPFLEISENTSEEYDKVSSLLNNDNNWVVVQPSSTKEIDDKIKELSEERDQYVKPLNDMYMDFMFEIKMRRIQGIQTDELLETEKQILEKQKIYDELKDKIDELNLKKEKLLEQDKQNLYNYKNGVQYTKTTEMQESFQWLFQNACFKPLFRVMNYNDINSYDRIERALIEMKDKVIQTAQSYPLFYLLKDEATTISDNMIIHPDTETAIKSNFLDSYANNEEGPAFENMLFYIHMQNFLNKNKINMFGGKSLSMGNSRRRSRSLSHINHAFKRNPTLRFNKKRKSRTPSPNIRKTRRKSPNKKTLNVEEFRNYLTSVPLRPNPLIQKKIANKNTYYSERSGIPMFYNF